MNFFKQNPFVRFIIPLIFGILIQFYLSFNIIDIIWIFSVILVLTIAVLIINLSFSYQYIKGVFINLSIIIYGVLITSLHQSEYHKIETTNNTILTAKIVKTPKERESDYKLSLIIDGEKTNEKWRKTRSKAIAYLRKDSANIKLKAGDRIVFQPETLPVKQVNNPFDFDYYQYLSLKQIYNVFYIKNSNLFLTPNNTIDFKSKILNLRKKIIDIYKQSGLTTDNLAILSALSLGYRDVLSTDIRQAYIGAGAMHILAVSGLHVGIIYLILYDLLLRKIRRLTAKRP
jgi:competence protein ComEC